LFDGAEDFLPSAPKETTMELTSLFHKKFDSLSKDAIHCYLWLADELFAEDMQDKEYVITRTKKNLSEALDWKLPKVRLALNQLKDAGLLKLNGRKIVMKLR
jgi:hypothetical protein